jgi:uncharacterized membrane protein
MSWNPRSSSPVGSRIFARPTFILLAGLSAFLYGRERSVEELCRFLLIRGSWLILIDLTLIKFGWSFDVDLYRLTVGVIFVIGASMVALAGLIWLPRWAIAGVAFVMLGGHNLLDGVGAERGAEGLGLGTSCMSLGWCLSAMARTSMSSTRWSRG